MESSVKLLIVELTMQRAYGHPSFGVGYFSGVHMG
ncbi:hypothetical protein BH20ACI3_BH20ACI3_30460 [soil metagenome]